MFRILLTLLVFFTSMIPLAVFAGVRISEIAWMGTEASYTSEWIELENDSAEVANIDGWRITAGDGQPDIFLSGVLAAGGFFLLERSDDDTVPGVASDMVYTGALGNSGEDLFVFNASGGEVDRVLASGGWPAGDNETKETMQLVNGIWVTAVPTPRKENASTEISSEENKPSQAVNISEQSGKNQEPVSVYVPPKKMVTSVVASYPKVSVVGAPTAFNGEGLDAEGKPLTKVRYIWSFGDGARMEGQNVAHVYEYPGKYVVVLDVASGEYTAASRVTITITDAYIAITNVGPLGERFVEITNESPYELNVSGWIVTHGSQRFTIPASTFVPADSAITFSPSVTGFQGAASELFSLLYPNGKEAAVYNEAEPNKGELAVLDTYTEQITAGQTETPHVVVRQEEQGEKYVEKLPDVFQEDEIPDNENEVLAAAGVAQESGGEPSGFFSSLWFLFAVLLVGTAIAGFVAMRMNRNSVDEFTIIE